VAKAPIKPSDLFRYWKALPHQLAAIVELEAELLKVAPDLFNKDQPWFKTWSQGGKVHDYDAAVKLIKEFEGCHLSAYPDPLSGGDPWTIGYGTTRYSNGRAVQRGDKITVIDANGLLDLEVERIASKLRSTVPFWNAMTGDKQSALISFAYNLGSGFYGANGFETISKRLKDKDWAAVPDALLLYRNPGTNVEAGLLRRRQAEARLWGLPEVQQQPAKLLPSSPFSLRITPHITLGEFALGQEARRFDHQHQVDTAAELATFLERVRTAFGSKPVVITSGYRPPAINRSVGGASSSEHLYNAPSVGAVDFYVSGADIHAVQSWCDTNWPYSIGYGAPKGFVHLGIRQGRPKVRWDY
jgi:GH24 family phage-related lysozyme (muramidase)